MSGMNVTEGGSQGNIPIHGDSSKTMSVSGKHVKVTVEHANKADTANPIFSRVNQEIKGAEKQDLGNHTISQKKAMTNPKEFAKQKQNDILNCMKQTPISSEINKHFNDLKLQINLVKTEINKIQKNQPEEWRRTPEEKSKYSNLNESLIVLHNAYNNVQGEIRSTVDRGITDISNKLSEMSYQIDNMADDETGTKEKIEKQLNDLRMKFEDLKKHASYGNIDKENFNSECSNIENQIAKVNSQLYADPIRKDLERFDTELKQIKSKVDYKLFSPSPESLAQADELLRVQQQNISNLEQNAKEKGILGSDKETADIQKKINDLKSTNIDLRVKALKVNAENGEKILSDINSSVGITKREGVYTGSKKIWSCS